MESSERWWRSSAFKDLLQFIERGLLLVMGSIALGAWALMLIRLFSDFHPLFELATHTSLHSFAGCLGILVLELLFFVVRRGSIQAGPRWKHRLTFTLIPLIFFGWVTSPWRLLPLQKAAVTNAPSIKIMSWNILLVNRHVEEVIELARREQPDIIALIELSPLAAKKLEVLREEYPFGMWLPAWEGSGIGMLSRLPHSNFRTIYPANTWMPAIELELDRGPERGRLSLLSVHAVSPHAEDGERTVFRDAQLKELGAWAADKNCQAMIIGDLNISPWSPPFWRLLHQGRLADSTWYRGYFPSWPAQLGKFGIPIDHALVNERIRVLDRRNIYEHLHSDHFPVLITIQ